jgi:hypothetical protein
MGIALLRTFDPELRAIEQMDSTLYDLTKKILADCSDANAVEAASSSGKYHPQCDLGFGGLVRHTRNVVKCAMRMFDTNPRLGEVDKKVLFVAALLHDMDKYDDLSVHTNQRHPPLMADRIRAELTSDKSRAAKVKIQAVSDLIETHHGKWNKCEKTHGKPEEGFYTWAEPTSELQMILCYADMIASAQWFIAP